MCWNTNVLLPSSHLNWNCLGQFSEIPWNQTSDVHRGSTLNNAGDNVTLASQKPVNTISSVIAAKQTA